MNKLYIDQQGIIKVIDVPGRPALCRIEGVLISDYCSAACYCNPMASYRKAVAAAKEAGIELCTDNLTAKQLFDFLADIGIEGVESHQWLEKHKGEIIDLPEGWSIYFAWRCLKCGRLDCISCDSDCELDQKVAVLLPPVSQIKLDRLGNTSEPKLEKVESQEDHIPDSSKMAQVVVNTGALEAILKEKDDRIVELEQRLNPVQQESQEELWDEAQLMVKEHLGSYSNDLVCDLARWAVEALKKHYMITRK